MKVGRALMLLACLVAACTQPEPLRGVDLPPASVPDTFEDSPWAITFSHEFTQGVWAEGSHTYRLELDCPVAMSEPLATGALSFLTNSRTQVLDGKAYLRLVGLSDSITGPRNLVNISTDQPTAAIVTLVGMALETAEAARDCSGLVSFDDGGIEVLVPGEPFRP